MAGSNGIRSATTTVDTSAATAPSSGQVLTATASTTATWQTPSGGDTLLLNTSGTHTSTSPTTVASVATGAMASSKRLRVEVNLDAHTQNGGTASIYSVTDSAVIMDLMAGGSTLQAEADYEGTAFIGQNPRVNTFYQTNIVEVQAAWPAGTGQTGSSTARYGSYTLTTAYTTGFTIGLRLGGVISGGSEAWRIKVYLLA